jgi:hypothetical protein
MCQVNVKKLDVIKQVTQDTDTDILKYRDSFLMRRTARKEAQKE